MDHQDAADRASDELSVDLYSALIHGDPAAPVDTPAYRHTQQPLRDVLSDLVCGAEVCDPLLRAIAAAVAGAPNAQALTVVAVEALIAAHISRHMDAAAERELEREEERALEDRHGRCEWDNPRAYA